MPVLCSRGMQWQVSRDGGEGVLGWMSDEQ
jgi:hypothetical protein